MIRTELKESELYRNGLRIKEHGLERHLRYFDRDLVLLWNIDNPAGWEVYRIKRHGLDPTYHWQISVPRDWGVLSPGLIEWLKQLDTSKGGYLSKDEMRKNWLNMAMAAREKQRLEKEKRRSNLILSASEVFNSGLVNKIVVCLGNPKVFSRFKRRK